MKTIKIGWAQTDITPERPVYLAGQLYDRISEYVHDPVTATALAIDAKEDCAIIVSVDTVFIPEELLSLVRRRLIDSQIDADKISISATHTHNSFTFRKSLMETAGEIIGNDMVENQIVPGNIMNNEEIKVFLADKISNLIQQAWDRRKEGGISYALDYAAVAFNRRPVFKNGESTMYGDCSKDDFVRPEGPSDHMADMLYTWNLEGGLTGVLVNIPCPSQVMELHRFISADYWHTARGAIRKKLGNIFILPVCGAGGDQNPLDLIRISRDNKRALVEWGKQRNEVFRNIDMALECRNIGDRIADTVWRGYNKARNTIKTDIVFKHNTIEMSFPLRTVDENEVSNARHKIEQAKKEHSPDNRMKQEDIIELFDEIGVVSRWNEQQANKYYDFEAHVIRIGNIVFVTNPFELFTEYGMRIKAKSAAEQTFIAQLANGRGGYLPTEAALSGGSYSSKPASTKCGPKEGDMLVDGLLHGIREMFGV